MPEDEWLTVAQLSGLIKWTEELRDQGFTLQGVIDRTARVAGRGGREHGRAAALRAE
jgi:hypothetical protein